MTKPRFTAAEHAALGESLARVHDVILTEKVKIEQSFPTTRPGHSQKASQALKKALAAVDEARYAMENELIVDYPSASTWVYFPQRGN